MKCWVLTAVIEIRQFSVLLLMVFLMPATALGTYIAPQNLNPGSTTIRLDNSFKDDAWLVYTYDIGLTGEVENAVIHSSNGVPAVEQAVLQQLNALRYTPAERNGKPVKVSADPVIFTWILDKERTLSPRFQEKYQQAWDLYAQENYDAAFEIAVQLKSFPGRNALEEVKIQILAASLASRWDDEAAELQHLGRVVELQSLAINNNFKNRYVESDQYLKILKRIQTLQLNKLMLADAKETLDIMQDLALGTEIAQQAQRDFNRAEATFNTMDDVAIKAELVPLYREGPGSWKAGLSRSRFSLSDVDGRVGLVFLVCGNSERRLPYPSTKPWTIPEGSGLCKIDVSGKGGTRFVLHQYQ